MSGLPAALVTVEELQAMLDEPDLVVVDCRFKLDDPRAGRREYESGHVPGAVYMSLDEHLTAASGAGRHPLPSPSEFAAALGRLGIGNDTTVVAYDADAMVAPRLWWMLMSLGHGAVAVLDGGWAAWIASGAAVSSRVTETTPTTFDAPDQWSGTVDRKELEAALGTVEMVDARAAERYRGDIEPIDPVAGHIPTAVNRPWAANLDRDGRFRSAAELGARYAGLERPVVYCGSGVSACTDIFAMRLAGIDAVLYPGSWSDWCATGGAVALGEHPGTAP